MKNTMKIITVGLIITVFLFLRCRSKGADILLGIKGTDGIGNKGTPNSTQLIGFRYSLNESPRGNSYTYEIKDKKFTYTTLAHSEYAEISIPVDDMLLEKLKKVYIEAECYKWDGYSKYDTRVLDGYNFSLLFQFEDGKSCFASGSNRSPENYKQFVKGMQELLEPLADKIVEHGKQKKIAEGFPGKVKKIVMSFVQQGNSGEDKYSFNIYSADSNDENNLDISIRSVSEEFLPKGDYKYFGHLDKQYVDFTELDNLIDKYQLINWYDYYVIAPDSNNMERFNISIKFNDGKHLYADGTEKPENYDAFRQEFLSYMIRFIDSIKDVYKPYSHNK